VEDQRQQPRQDDDEAARQGPVARGEQAPEDDPHHQRPEQRQHRQRGVDVAVDEFFGVGHVAEDAQQVAEVGEHRLRDRVRFVFDRLRVVGDRRAEHPGVDAQGKHREPEDPEQVHRPLLHQRPVAGAEEGGEHRQEGDPPDHRERVAAGEEDQADDEGRHVAQAHPRLPHQADAGGGDEREHRGTDHLRDPAPAVEIGHRDRRRHRDHPRQLGAPAGHPRLLGDPGPAQVVGGDRSPVGEEDRHFGVEDVGDEPRDRVEGAAVEGVIGIEGAQRRLQVDAGFMEGPDVQALHVHQPVVVAPVAGEGAVREQDRSEQADDADGRDRPVPAGAHESDSLPSVSNGFLRRAGSVPSQPA
jgi:hypothetical protein